MSDSVSFAEKRLLFSKSTSIPVMVLAYPIAGEVDDNRNDAIVYVGVTASFTSPVLSSVPWHFINPKIIVHVNALSIADITCFTIFLIDKIIGYYHILGFC